jgi:hypothetical protein
MAINSPVYPGEQPASKIPSFRTVTADPPVYCGGQPGSKAAWEYLRNIGVTNVVKLNCEEEASDDSARELGMTVQYFPIDFHLREITLDGQTVSNAVAAIKPGTYVHCTYGRDRTGLVVGCIRVWQENWSKADAWNEMIADGFNPSLSGLTKFWENSVR